MNEQILIEKYKALQNDYDDVLWQLEHLGKITDEYRDKYNELLDRNSKAINILIVLFGTDDKDINKIINILKGKE